jgi:hypothetical protein
VSEFAVAYPRSDDIDRYARHLRVPRLAVVRDIARIVTVAQMAWTGELNEEWALCGSMGLRLRGSPRFTMMDTDTSRIGTPDNARLAASLTVDHDELVVAPAGVQHWGASKQLITAQPVDFEAFFAAVGVPVEGKFTFTVSWRGLFERPERLALTHPYSELLLPQVEVPVMDLTEQVAEKIVGWCAHGLIKHYIDIAWIFKFLESEIDSGKLGPLTERKLDVGRGLFPDAYLPFDRLEALFEPLYDPDRVLPTLGASGELGLDQIRFAGGRLTKEEAVAIVRKRLLPSLFTSHGDAVEEAPA